MLLSHSFNRMSLGLLYQQTQHPVNGGLLRGGTIRADPGQTFVVPPPTPLPSVVSPSPPGPLQFTVGTQSTASPAAPPSMVVSQPTSVAGPVAATATPAAEMTHTAPTATAPLVIIPNQCCAVVDGRQCKNKWRAPEVVIGNESFKLCGQHNESHGRGNLRAVFDARGVSHNVRDLTAAGAAAAPAAPAVPAAASSAPTAPAAPITTTPASDTTPYAVEDEEEYKSAE